MSNLKFQGRPVQTKSQANPDNFVTNATQRPTSYHAALRVTAVLDALTAEYASSVGRPQ